MLSFGGTTEETARDQRLYLDSRLVEVACLDCLATVQVKKNSPHHTSVQWSAEAVGECPEFARMSQQAGGRSLRATCPRMMASIEHAVEEGVVPIGATDGY